MKNNSMEEQWRKYRDEELARAKTILAEFGYSIDDRQPHIDGERYLMMSEHDVGESGFKLVLNGTRNDNKRRAIIKLSSTQGGKQEIERERNARQTLTDLNFSYKTFLTPAEWLYANKDGCTIAITEFIEQEKGFIERPLKEQFTFALAALKIQESVHAATYAQANSIRSTYGIYGAKEYLEGFRSFKTMIERDLPSNRSLEEIMVQAESAIEGGSEVIEQYSNFLTHSDFVPHNLRIKGDDIYLLDYASIHFGNKHESWARFINFMALYNPELEAGLVQYVSDNRTKEEFESLRLMRMYKLAFLLHFYTQNLHHTIGSQKEMTEARIMFWTEVFRAVLRNEQTSIEHISTYTKIRDTLRSNEEKERQVGLH